MKHDVWATQAEENVDEWGVQHPAEILLAMQEELGELTQAWLKTTYEEEPRDVEEELDDLAALCYQFMWSWREHPGAYEPITER
jgi:NTP pyrophosphatase (non-canonical NTP hydrolase)